ncbi:DNA (cytosine-5)-methyltransferase 1 [Spiroplasma chinense]|uniref:Cytosine-specific methyltransferase n=1 Tax=Spiroplasma chinense TaxID=216932 RepID=A0A5B9Y592_9MOLU|nr:DNA (cytosine-5-)-methyltransferase [Spiroplasma chinense]QEH61963.1 DNA (cytosine-5)-methyltransferase 1 [Spiroplasma chinense]
MKSIKVIELFAGVGGFRLGLEQYNKDLFDFVFTNQWEPGKKIQHAFDCYVNNFGSENAYNEDISKVKYDIPEDCDLLVGGFPCQDYSVAATNAKGIEGKKGVLWWEISWILEHKKPKMVLLENVDRLLKSPSNQRGRDFAIMLMNMHNLGYDVEWQVINAADYGMPQRRKRVFIFAKLRELSINENIERKEISLDVINVNSIFERDFPVIEKNIKKPNLFLEFVDTFQNELHVTSNYNLGKFFTKGFLINGYLYQYEVEVNKNLISSYKVLNDILLNDADIDKKYVLNASQLKKMKELKGAKKKERIKPNGEHYIYSEGKMSLNDEIYNPGRTMLTSESSLNRSTHIIKFKEGNRNRYRFITPVEAERLNCFPDNWTSSIESEKMRYFCMGNALVVDIITKLANQIETRIELFGNNKSIKVTKKADFNNKKNY